MRGMPPNARGFDVAPTEISYGLPASASIVGMLWRFYDNNEVIATATRGDSPPGPQVSAFSILGTRSPLTERTVFEIEQGVVLPGPMGHVLGRALGSLSSDPGWSRNCAIIGPDKQRTLTTDTDWPYPGRAGQSPGVYQ